MNKVSEVGIDEVGKEQLLVQFSQQLLSMKKVNLQSNVELWIVYQHQKKEITLPKTYLFLRIMVGQSSAREIDARIRLTTELSMIEL